jgi:hypothetical protein
MSMSWKMVTGEIVTLSGLRVNANDFMVILVEDDTKNLGDIKRKITHLSLTHTGHSHYSPPIFKTICDQITESKTGGRGPFAHL